MALSTSAAFAADAASTSEPAADTASAPAPITIEGNAFFQYRNNTDNNHTSGFKKKTHKTGITLNFKNDLGAGWNAYARASMEAGSVGTTDFSQTYGDGEYGATIDQFGFHYTEGDTEATVGRQGTIIGATGLFYDLTTKFGRHAETDGVNYSGKSGLVNYKVTAVQEDWDYGTVDNVNVGVSKNRLYAGHADYNFTDNFLAGATFASYVLDKHNSGAEGLNSRNSHYWAVNSAYTNGSANYFFEYGRSNLGTQNTAYDFGVGYAFDDRNNASITYYSVENLADINHFTTFDPNAKGLYYSYTHNFNKSTSLTLFFNDAKHLDTNNDYTSFRTTLSYNF